MAVKVEAPHLRLDPEVAGAPLDWRDVFGGRDGPVEVEIGVGKARFMLAAAEARPDVLHLGVEWANKYLRIAESRAAKRGLENVRFIRCDAVDLLQHAIPDASVRAYYVFYPDPWPKKRHRKRRLLRSGNVEHFVRTLLPHGALHVATDHVEYWEQIEPLLDNEPALERLAEFGGPGFPMPIDRPLTNYEAKYRVEGRNRHRGSWRRVP